MQRGSDIKEQSEQELRCNMALKKNGAYYGIFIELVYVHTVYKVCYSFPPTFINNQQWMNCFPHMTLKWPSKYLLSNVTSTQQLTSIYNNGLIIILIYPSNALQNNFH